MTDTNVDATNPVKITFADLGIPQAPQLEHNDVIGTARKLSDISRHEKIYVCGMVVSILVLLSLTVYRLAIVGDEDADFAFCLVLLLNSFFCILYVFDGVKRERPSELLLLSLAIILMVIYLVVNYVSGKKTSVKLARMVVACVLACPLVIYGFYLTKRYHSEGHMIFRIVGSAFELQALMTKLYGFQDLLKFDLELQLSLIILMLGSRVSIDTKDYVILSAGIPLSITWFLIGYIGFNKESKGAAIAFFILCTPGIAYMGYKMWHLSKYIDTHPGLAAATIACLVIGLIVRMLVIVLGAKVYLAFGKGLKRYTTTLVVENA